MNAASTLTVMIVDDETLARVRLRDLLADIAAEVPNEVIAEAANGQLAVEALKEHFPDVMLLDIRMPKMDGIEFLQAVRSNPNTKKAAFIILTAQGDRALVQKAAALGANNVLAKPFTIEKMKAAIEAVFGALK